MKICQPGHYLSKVLSRLVCSVVKFFRKMFGKIHQTAGKLEASHMTDLATTCMADDSGKVKQPSL